MISNIISTTTNNERTRMPFSDDNHFVGHNWRYYEGEIKSPRWLQRNRHEQLSFLPPSSHSFWKRSMSHSRCMQTKFKGCESVGRRGEMRCRTCSELQKNVRLDRLLIGWMTNFKRSSLQVEIIVLRRFLKIGIGKYDFFGQDEKETSVLSRNQFVPRNRFPRRNQFLGRINSWGGINFLSRNQF